MTKSTKLIEFQFKLLHKRLPTNSYLYKIKIKDNENCSFCKMQKEEIIHLFWNCEHVTRLWKRIEEMLKRHNIFSGNFNINIATALGLKQSTSKKTPFYSASVFLWLETVYGIIAQTITSLSSKLICINSKNTIKWTSPKMRTSAMKSKLCFPLSLV